MIAHLPRIDAHVHFWEYDAVEYAWIDGSMASLRRDFGPAEALAAMHAAGFDRCVAVQARQTLHETRWLLTLADEHPCIAAVVGWVDLQAPDITRQLESVAGSPKLVGVRHIVQSEPDDFLARPAFRRGIGAVERSGLAYDILVCARQLPAVLDFVRAFPSQRFVLDHLGKPGIREGAYDAWRRDVDRLAARPNVFAKLSGLVTEADWGSWRPGDLHRYINAALDSFGAERLMIGSDWPVCTLAGAYSVVMDVVMTALAERTAAERDAVLGDTARRFWNLSPMESNR